ncbi:hypothetical protein CY34DRAFT_807316 [Suillus luteus UH-Slu-Lm8-n1]|uniref:Uncharacterized protein n=1 Tax=Suillus luteus UH-Slu-Lm8-n1 TaxID=930992 RepID=A0A0D0B9L8_9AGAM|nr:hypothetical protein CY34DRAFT_807316 [Suillus luteus UH-Slu-Lm8-n1]
MQHSSFDFHHGYVLYIHPGTLLLLITSSDSAMASAAMTSRRCKSLTATFALQQSLRRHWTGHCMTKISKKYTINQYICGCVSCEGRQYDQLNAEQQVFDLIYKAIYNSRSTTYFIEGRPGRSI